MKWQLVSLLVVCSSCKPKPGLSHQPTAKDSAFADSMIAAQASQARRSADSVVADSARRDTLAFAMLADSMEMVEDQIVLLGSDSSVARLLLQLGKMKERAIGRMIVGAQYWQAGVRYARTHDSEYGYFDPDGQFYYNGIHFKQLLTRFPSSSLADSARWYLAHLQRGHGD